jgi:fatty-acyl-CoA synthase
MANPYDTGLDKTPANYQPLTPLVFLERAASVHPAHTAIIHGKEHISYADFYARARKLGSALASRGFAEGDTVWSKQQVGRFPELPDLLAQLK